MKYLITLLLFVGTSAFADSVTFDKDVRSIFIKRCTLCHNSKVKLLPDVTKYEVAYKLKDTILEKVIFERSMPHSGRMTEHERNTVGLWIETGARK